MFKLLNYSFDEQTKFIYNQNYYYSLLKYVTGNVNALSVMWNFYNDHYLLLNEKLEERSLASLGNSLCSYFANEQDKQKVFS